MTFISTTAAAYIGCISAIVTMNLLRYLFLDMLLASKQRFNERHNQ